MADNDDDAPFGLAELVDGLEFSDVPSSGPRGGLLTGLDDDLFREWSERAALRHLLDCSEEEANEHWTQSRAADELCGLWERAIKLRAALAAEARKPVRPVSEEDVQAFAQHLGVDPQGVRSWFERGRQDAVARKKRAAKRLARFNRDLFARLIEPQRPTKDAIEKLVADWSGADAGYAERDWEPERKQAKFEAVARAFRWSLPIVEVICRSERWPLAEGQAGDSIDIAAELAGVDSSSIELAATTIHTVQLQVMDPPPRLPSDTGLRVLLLKTDEDHRKDTQFVVDALFAALRSRAVREAPSDGQGPVKACYRLIEHMTGLSARTIRIYVQNALEEG